MSKFHTTQKGTKLPIMNLKGKDYMMVAYRIQWFREENPLGRIETDIVKLETDYAVVKAKISLPDVRIVTVDCHASAANSYVLMAEATKKEDVKGFADFIEKAETGAIGRALALAGYGTQFSVPEFDEENRLADSPLGVETNVKEASPASPPPAKRSSFRRPKPSEMTLIQGDKAPEPVKLDPPSVLTSESSGWEN